MTKEEIAEILMQSESLPASIMILEQFIDQQTAEKDKRIREMEEDIEIATTKLNEATVIIKQATELYKSLSRLVFLHECEQEGLSSGQPTPEMWFEAVNKAEEVLTKINQIK